MDKDFTKQIVEWNERLNKMNPTEQLSVEVQIATFMLIYNIDDNISLIRDMIAKKLGFKG